MKLHGSLRTEPVSLYAHVNPNQTKIIPLNVNTKQIITLDSYFGQLDKNCDFKCEYLGNITPCGPFSTVIAQ